MTSDRVCELAIAHPAALANDFACPCGGEGWGGDTGARPSSLVSPLSSLSSQAARDNRGRISCPPHLRPRRRPRPSHARGRAVREAPGGARALLRVRPSLPDPAGPARASARSASTRAARCACPSATSARCRCDPIEKKPFFHALPGARRALLRHARLRLPLRLLPELADVAGAARSRRGRAARSEIERRASSAALAATPARRIVTSTYNEPLITSEWAVAVFREAKAAGLVCSYVSNGNGTPEVLDYIRPWVDSTRSTSRASATATTASSAARSSACSARSARCTRGASGSRS